MLTDVRRWTSHIRLEVSERRVTYSLYIGVLHLFIHFFMKVIPFLNLPLNCEKIVSSTTLVG